MQKIKAFALSFSFRAGAVIFCILSLLLIAQRLLIHFQAVETAYEDIRLIIDAHEEEVDESMERYGAEHVKVLLAGMSQNLHDKHLFMLLKQQSNLTGNLKAWPNVDFKGKDYTEIMVQQEGADPLHLLVSVSEYSSGTKLLIGYDLDRVDDLREDLVQSLFENVAIALGVSLAVSALVIWLLSQHLRRFNAACDKVMSGDLDYRIATGTSRDEFDKLASNINRMLDWNKALITTVKDSTNAIAHDMRTPLSRLRLELRMLAEQETLDANTRAQLQSHVERVDGLTQMFENILNIAKAESRSSTELFEMVDMAQLVQDVLDFYAPVIEEKQLALQTSLPETPLMLRADKQLLSQAVMNLLDNACKYTPKCGMIDVQLTRDHERVLLTLADNGPGIPPELMDKAKERFFRLDASRHTSGHGLGLSLASAVAALHHGTLELYDNHPGLKAVFSLRSAL